MARRLYEARDCVRYARSIVPAPVIELTLRDVLGEVSLSGEFLIDTGFEGDVMVPWDDFRHFISGELPEELWRIYTTAGGAVIRMRTARAIAVVGGNEIEVLVETPLIGEGRRLVGRGALRNLKLGLDGPDELTCLLSELEPQ